MDSDVAFRKKAHIMIHTHEFISIVYFKDSHAEVVRAVYFMDSEAEFKSAYILWIQAHNS